VAAPDLRPLEPLTQVVFVHDYLQLVFQDSRFSFCYWPTLQVAEAVLERGAAGYCDTLVSLIGQGVRSVDADGTGLSLRFQNGALLLVPSFDPDCNVPEAWTFSTPGHPRVVEPNTPADCKTG
jgi:hypothetical protein